jgi:NAD(P)-dependent dehydrogenase (short-subunit alcohol dehydrogenase family)
MSFHFPLPPFPFPSTRLTRHRDVNLKGALITARIGLAFLRRNGGGDLILVSSIAGWKECTGLVAYTASKHGVIGIMRGLHLSAVKEGVRINVICPWMTSASPLSPNKLCSF